MFFEYNEQNFGINNDLTYVEFAEKFAYQPDNKVWSLRKNQSPGIRQQAIGRLPMLTPANGEVFYLRMLLSHSHCKGKKSFIELRKVAGCVYPSYLETCNALGILDNDEEWDSCLEEAEFECGPARFRMIFATIICFNSPSTVPEPLIKDDDRLGEDVGQDLRGYET